MSTSTTEPLVVGGGVVGASKRGVAAMCKASIILYMMMLQCNVYVY
jgi:hypothetical protein